MKGFISSRDSAEIMGCIVDVSGIAHKEGKMMVVWVFGLRVSKNV